MGKQDVFDVELQQRLRKLCEGALLANEAAVQSKIVGELELCLDYFRDHVRAERVGYAANRYYCIYGPQYYAEHGEQQPS